MAGSLLLAVLFFGTNANAQTYDYPFANATSCSASVEFWYEYTCGVDNLNGYATFTVPAYTTVTHTIPSTASPEKIYVTVAGQLSTWLCGTNGFSPGTTYGCYGCAGGSSNRVMVQGYTTDTKIDCAP